MVDQLKLSDGNLLASLPEQWLLIIVISLTLIGVCTLVGQWWLIKKRKTVKSVSIAYLFTTSIGCLFVIFEGVLHQKLSTEVILVVCANIAVLPFFLFVAEKAIQGLLAFSQPDISDDDTVRILFMGVEITAERDQSDPQYALMQVKFTVQVDEFFWFRIIMGTYGLLRKLITLILVRYFLIIIDQPVLLAAVPVVLFMAAVLFWYFGVYTRAATYLAMVFLWLLIPYAFLVILFGPFQQLWILWLTSMGAWGTGDIIIKQVTPFAVIEMAVRPINNNASDTDATGALAWPRLAMGILATGFWVVFLWNVSFTMGLLLSICGLVAELLTIATFITVKLKTRKQRSTVKAA